MRVAPKRTFAFLLLFFTSLHSAGADEPYTPDTLKIIGPVKCRTTVDGKESLNSILDQTVVTLQERIGKWYRVQGGAEACWIHQKNLRMPKDKPKFAVDCPPSIQVKPEVPKGFSLSGWLTPKFYSIFVGGGGGPSGKNGARSVLNIEVGCSYILGPENTQQKFSVKKSVPIYYDCPLIGTSLPPGVSHLECSLSTSESDSPSIMEVKNGVENMVHYDPKSSVNCALDAEDGSGMEKVLKDKSCSDQEYPSMVGQFCTRNERHQGYYLKRYECSPSAGCRRVYVSELKRCPGDEGMKTVLPMSDTQKVFCTAAGFGPGNADHQISIQDKECDKNTLAKRAHDFCAKWPKDQFYLETLGCEVEHGKRSNSCNVLSSTDLRKCGTNGEAVPVGYGH